MPRFIIVFLLCSLIGCTNEAIKFPPKPKADHTTPDNVVKSLWAEYDWQEQCDVLRFQKVWKEFGLFALKTRQSKLAEIEAHRVKPSARKDNKIDKVDIQSQTRALVFTTESEYIDDKKSTKFQYILTTDSKNWVIEDIITSCYGCNGTGEADDYEKSLANLKSGIFTTPKITCPICKGKGVKSIILKNL